MKRENKHQLMDSGLNESKQGNKEGWGRVLVLVQVVGKVGAEKIGSCAPVCLWEPEVTG